ncbi:hypothetical protein [Catellatospora sp. NPDC049133]|uniref:hypothetical protein n=1 Tax=Catellatospora sp. NPDC049133 TaxID=3155499 RepID=UPI0033CB95EE
MAAEYYHADTENGDYIVDPSEDALFMLIEDLNATDNTFLTIEPPGEEPAWYASVSLLENGVYEVERNHPERRIHELTTETDRGKIAKDLTIWLAATGRFTRQSSTATDF